MTGKAPWPRPRELDEEDARPAAGRPKGAVPHAPDGETRGRRHSVYPNLDITQTAQWLGISKAHLSRILTGQNRPSVALALRLAEALGWPVDKVLGLYRQSH